MNGVVANAVLDPSVFPHCNVIVADWNSAKSEEFLIQHSIAFIIDVSKIAATRNQKLLYSKLGITRTEFKIDDGIATNKQLMGNKKNGDGKRLIHRIWETITEYTSVEGKNCLIHCHAGRNRSWGMVLLFALHKQNRYGDADYKSLREAVTKICNDPKVLASDWIACFVTANLKLVSSEFCDAHNDHPASFSNRTTLPSEEPGVATLSLKSTVPVDEPEVPGKLSDIDLSPDEKEPTEPVDEVAVIADRLELSSQREKPVVKSVSPPANISNIGLMKPDGTEPTGPVKEEVAVAADPLELITEREGPVSPPANISDIDLTPGTNPGYEREAAIEDGAKPSARNLNNFENSGNLVEFLLALAGQGSWFEGFPILHSFEEARNATQTIDVSPWRLFRGKNPLRDLSENGVADMELSFETVGVSKNRSIIADVVPYCPTPEELTSVFQHLPNLQLHTPHMDFYRIVEGQHRVQAIKNMMIAGRWLAGETITVNFIRGRMEHSLETDYSVQQNALNTTMVKTTAVDDLTMAAQYIRTHRSSFGNLKDCVRQISRKLASYDPKKRNEAHFRPIVNAALHLLEDGETWKLLHDVNTGKFRDSLGKSQVISNTDFYTGDSVLRSITIRQCVHYFQHGGIPYPASRLLTAMKRFAKYAAQKILLDEEVEVILKRHPGIPALTPNNWSEEMKADIVDIFYTGDKLESRIEGCKSTLAPYFKDKLFKLLVDNVPEDEIQYAVEAREGPLKFTRLNIKRANKVKRLPPPLPAVTISKKRAPEGHEQKLTTTKEQRHVHPDPLGQLLSESEAKAERSLRASKRKAEDKNSHISSNNSPPVLQRSTNDNKKMKLSSSQVVSRVVSPMPAPVVTIETVVDDGDAAAATKKRISKFAWRTVENDDTSREYARCADFIFCAMGGKDLSASIKSISYMLKPNGLALLEVVPSVTQEVTKLPEHLKEVKVLQVPLKCDRQILPTSLTERCVANFVLLGPASGRAITFGDSFSWPTGTKSLASDTVDSTIFSESAVKGMLQELFHERQSVTKTTLVCASQDAGGTVARVCDGLGLPCLVFSATPKLYPDTSWVTGGFLLDGIHHILASYSSTFPDVSVSVASDPDWYYADGVQKYNEVYDSSHSAQVISAPPLITFKNGRYTVHSRSKSVGNVDVRFIILPFQPEVTHWAVIIVDISEGSLFFIDSLSKHFKPEFACRAHMYCGMFTRDLPPVQNLRFFSEQTSPQKNSYDCGIFVMSSVLMFLRSKVKLISHCPSQQNMAAVRMYFAELGKFKSDSPPAEMFQTAMPPALASSPAAAKFNFAVVAVGNISETNQ